MPGMTVFPVASIVRQAVPHTLAACAFTASSLPILAMRPSSMNRAVFFFGLEPVASRTDPPVMR